MKIRNWLDGQARSVRYSWRVLFRTPVFTLTVVSTLGLAIGANSTVFSTLSNVLLQPFSFPDSERLVYLTQRMQDVGDTSIAPLRLEDWNRLSSTFDSISGYRMIQDVSDTTGELPTGARRVTVMPRFFRVSGVAPALGRDFLEDEHRARGSRAVILSDNYWQNQFGADPQVLQQSVNLEGVPYAIVGVMPESFEVPGIDADIWGPHPVDATFAQARAITWFNGLGRLRKPVSIEDARIELELVQARLGQEHPDSDADIGVGIVIGLDESL